jgi:anti-sigma factor ChrR (cupin superfamily)
VSSCDRIRIELGGYVLGGLAEDERALVETHASACARCRSELDELEGTSRLLGALRPATPPAPADLELRVLSGHRRSARRRRTWLVAAALALSALAGLTAGAALDGWRSTPAPDAVLALTGEGQAGGDLRGEAALRQTPNGIAVQLALTGVAGSDEGYYHLWLHRGERRVSAGTFVGADGEARVQLACGGRLGDYGRLSLTWHPFGAVDEVIAVEADLP